MQSIGSAMAVLLGATSSARKGQIDATGVRVVHQALQACALSGLCIDVRPGQLACRDAAVSDPDGDGGLTARLERARVKAVCVSDALDEASVASLIEWAHADDEAALPKGLRGIHFELSPPPPPRSPSDLVQSLARDPDSGLDLITLMDGEAGRLAAASAQIAEVSDRIRQRLGRTRMAAAESELRRSLELEALRAHRIEYEAQTFEVDDGLLPELPADALVAVPDDAP